MLNLTFFGLLPTKNKNLSRERRYKTIILLISAIFLSSCATHRVILGEIEIWGNNEIRIDTPTRQ